MDWQQSTWVQLVAGIHPGEPAEESGESAAERRRVKKKLLYATLALVALLYGCAGPDRPPSAAAPTELPYARGLARALNLSVRVTGGTGASASVIVAEQGAWSGASGISEPDVPVTPDMLFDMASVGKNYLAALVLQLVEEGKLGLDDPLYRWLPDYAHIDRAITVRQLLNHTSGVHDFVEHPQSPYWMPFDAIEFGTASSPEEVVSTLVGEPYFAPGDGFRYSTTN
jgi:D-alanyl-D-alanine carboxypeptidase